jgi:hypothetical protein
MNEQPRLYTAVLRDHIEQHRQMNLPYEQADCFKVRKPVVVPAKTFLSQLL